MSDAAVETLPCPNCGAHPQWFSAEGKREKAACRCGVSGPWAADDGRHTLDAARRAWNRAFGPRGGDRPGDDDWLRTTIHRIEQLMAVPRELLNHERRLAALEAQATDDSR